MATTFLEMHSRSELIAGHSGDGEFRVEEMSVRQWQVNKFMYGFVGGQWQWVNRLAWSDQEWQRYAEDENIRTFLGFKQGALAGYFELNKCQGDVEIAYFGLTPQFIGRGYGKHMLTRCIEEAWDWGASRVWVHTCSLDHPSALPNYQARGLKVYKTMPENI